MARHNGQKVHEKILELLKDGNPVTPQQICNAIGTKYCFQYIHKLRSLGYNVKSQKDGVKVLAYVLDKSPVVMGTPSIEDQILASTPRPMGSDPFVDSTYIVDRDWDKVPRDVKQVL
jgi:hypothetical protein